MTIEAMKQAIEALEIGWSPTYVNGVDAREKGMKAIVSLRQAIQEEALRNVARLGQEIEQEPVAQYSDIVSDGGLDPRNKFDTPQPQREWVGLTDDEMLMIYGQNHEGKKYSLGRMVQAKLKEKNT